MAFLVPPHTCFNSLLSFMYSMFFFLKSLVGHPLLSCMHIFFTTIIKAALNLWSTVSYWDCLTDVLTNLLDFVIFTVSEPLLLRDIHLHMTSLIFVLSMLKLLYEILLLKMCLQLQFVLCCNQNEEICVASISS